MIRLLRDSLLVITTTLLLHPATAQSTDSVVVSGRIRNLSARLYRESPTVFISRNNILQASRELVRPAPLNVDGTFRVALPLIYPQEEMYFNYGVISTAFLAAPGTVSIELNADSLFTAAVPFRFGGVNAQVNQQFAQYKAFEAASPNKPDSKKLTDEVNGLGNDAAYRLVAKTYQAPFRAFAVREKPFPLLAQWVGSADRYNAASFVYDKATYEGEELAKIPTDSLRPPNDLLLTAARASAMDRFADYAMQQTAVPVFSNQGGGLSVQALSAVLLRYGRNLTETERTRLEEYRDKNTAKTSDLRFFNDLVKRSNDTIQRVVNYEALVQRSRAKFDSMSTIYLTASLLANALPGLTLDIARLLYGYARPQITDPYLGQSLDELYRLEVKDSARIRTAVQLLQKAGATTTNTEVSPGVFVSRDATAGGRTLFDRVVAANRGKVLYVLMTDPNSDAGRQAAVDAQRLRDVYRSRDVALIYLPIIRDDARLWTELGARYQLSGEHLLVSEDQLGDLFTYLRPVEGIAAAVVSRTGKVVKRNAPLPGAFAELRKVVDKNL